MNTLHNKIQEAKKQAVKERAKELSMGKLGESKEWDDHQTILFQRAFGQLADNVLQTAISTMYSWEQRGQVMALEPWLEKMEEAGHIKFEREEV